VTRWLWQAADGTVTDLSEWGAGNYVTADGTAGQFAPAYEFATQAFAGIDGAALQQITAQPRQPVLGLDLVASDGDELRQRLRGLAHALRPRAGIGRLTAIGDDGAERWLPCYYQGGLEQGAYVVNRFRAALTFWSPSPWWRGEWIEETWGLAAPPMYFPILPITLAATTIGGSRTIDLSDTDAPTYPTWTIVGPGDQLTLTNEYQRLDEQGLLQTYSAELVLNAPIGDGRTVTIDTRPGYQRITRDDGVSLFSSLASDPAMWPLVDGLNTVTALLTNAGDLSSLALTGYRLHSGAL
jgi:hypothetical protein